MPDFDDPKPTEKPKVVTPRGPEDCAFSVAVAAKPPAFAGIAAAENFSPANKDATSLAPSRWHEAEWLPVTQADAAIRSVAAFIGRLEVCYVSVDGLPRPLDPNDPEPVVDSATTISCTAILLSDNKILFPQFCLEDPSLTDIGLTAARNRIVFGDTQRDSPGMVIAFDLEPDATTLDSDEFAGTLKIKGDANAALGGFVDIRSPPLDEPFAPLVMLHYPKGWYLSMTTGPCMVHPAHAQQSPQEGKLIHTCPTTSGSSGGLMLNARTLEPLAMHIYRAEKGKRTAITFSGLAERLEQAD